MDEREWLDQGLLIPYALRTPLEEDPERRQRVRSQEADAGRVYWCPECGHRLRAFGGTQHQRRHFRHQEYVEHCGFREDGADKVFARHALLDAVLRWVSDRAQAEAGVWLIRRCPNCSERQPEQSLPATVAKVRLKLEVDLANGHRRTADVALLGADDQVLCLIEIHRDREPPQFRFQGQTSFPWIILPARSTIAEPRHLEVEHEGNLRTFKCPICLARPAAPHVPAWEPAAFRRKITSPAPAQGPTADLRELPTAAPPAAPENLTNAQPGSPEAQDADWIAAVTRRLPESLMAELADPEWVYVVNVDAGSIYKRLKPPIRDAQAYCHYLNSQLPDWRYCVVWRGQVLPPAR